MVVRWWRWIPGPEYEMARGRFIQIGGDAELVTEGANEHLDALTRKYTSHRTYYG
jgi:hypothetical protein